MNNKNGIGKDGQRILMTVQREAEKAMEKLREYSNLLISKINIDDFMEICKYCYNSYLLSSEEGMNDKYLVLNGIKFINPYSAEINYAYFFSMSEKI